MQVERPAYVWNGSAFVPFSPASAPLQSVGTLVMPPAQAGPRADNSAIARFGNTGANGNVGLAAASDGGVDAIYDSAKAFGIWSRRSSDGLYTRLAYFDTRPVFLANPIVKNGANTAIDFDNRADNRAMAIYAQGDDIYLYDVSYGNQLTVRKEGVGAKLGPRSGGWFGRHPIHTGHIGFWSGESANEAWFLTNSGEALVNAASGYVVSLRVNQAGILDATATEVISYRKIRSYVTSVTSQWSDAALVAYAANSGVDNCRVSLNGWGVAPQIRGHTSEGDTVSGINQTSGGYCPFKGLAYVTVSTKTRKKDIRTFGGFRREHRRPKKQDWKSDVVPDDISVMDLRPVAFRHTEPAWVLTEEGKSVPRSLDTILGRQGHREHLGLVAEEVATVIPTAVVYDDNGENPGIDYSQITVALLEHVQRLTDEVATLRYRIAELEKV